jgi:hypothetical protein
MECLTFKGKGSQKQESINTNTAEGAWKDFPKEDLDKHKKSKSRKREKSLLKMMDTNDACNIWATKDSVY